MGKPASATNSSADLSIRMQETDAPRRINEV